MFTARRTSSSSPVLPKGSVRDTPLTARPSTRHTRYSEVDDGLQTLLDKETARISHFEQASLSELHQAYERLVREIKSSADRVELEIRRKCGDLRALLAKGLGDIRNSETGLRNLKGLLDANEGKVVQLTFTVEIPKVDLQGCAKVGTECKLGTELPIVPMLEQNLASPEYRRLKPLANYYERNKAAMPVALQELYGQILRTDSCRTIQLPNALGDKDVTHLCTLLEYSIGVRELSLDGKCIGPRGGMYLSKTFASLGALTLLNLRSNDLGDEGVRWVSVALPKLPKLTQLFLSSNNIGMEGAMHIARYIGQVPRIREFSLSANPIGSKGAVFISGSLPDMKELGSLNLSACNIGQEGAMAVLSVIGRIPKLKKIFIGNNDLGEEGRKLLGKIPGLRVFH